AEEVVSFAAGARFSIFVKNDGTCWAMGSNSSGQLGIEYPGRQLTPRAVASDVAAVAAGDSHTLLLKMDGSVWAMGDGRYGQVTGYVNLYTPTLVATEAVAIAAGNLHSLFRKAGGTLWGMGYSYSGQLGDAESDGIYIVSPQELTSEVTAFAAGGEHTLFLSPMDGAPVITCQPLNANIAAGQQATFSITSRGEADTYQWRRNGIAIAGATNARLNIASADPSMSGIYDVVVTDTSGQSAVSTGAALFISPAPVSSTRLVNLSTRGQARTAEQILIPGFVVQPTFRPSNQSAFRIRGPGRKRQLAWRRQCRDRSGGKAGGRIRHFTGLS
ncbi:MAG: hypothetical protein ACREIA_13680, partial [Opitutaceae bacterium]